MVGTFLAGCAVHLLLAGCAGVRSEAPEEKQGRTEATTGQAHSGGAASEEGRCGRMRTFKDEGAVAGWIYRGTYTTNDVPGCPNGGLISGIDKRDELLGGSGSDVLYGGPGADLLYGEEGDDVLYGATAATTTGCWREARARMWSTAGMATILFTRPTIGSEMSSIAVKG